MKIPSGYTKTIAFKVHVPKPNGSAESWDYAHFSSAVPGKTDIHAKRRIAYGMDDWEEISAEVFFSKMGARVLRGLRREYRLVSVVGLRSIVSTILMAQTYIENVIHKHGGLGQNEEDDFNLDHIDRQLKHLAAMLKTTDQQ